MRDTNFFSDLGEKIKNAFKGAFNWVARGWNDTVGKLSWPIPNWVLGVGGRTLSVPKIPMLATGGIVTAPTIAMVGEGREPEAVLPLSKLAAMLQDAGADASGSRGAPAINITNNYPQAEPTSTTVNRAQDYAAAIGGLG